MISIDSVKCVDDILAKAIDMVEQNISCYCTQPGVDFTRIRALPAGILIRFLIQKQAKALNQELSDFFVSKVPPSASASTRAVGPTRGRNTSGRIPSCLATALVLKRSSPTSGPVPDRGSLLF